MENNFTRTIREWLIDELANYKGLNIEMYEEDIASTITERINYDGSVNCSSYEAKKFICDNFAEFGELLDFYNNEFEIILNPFSEPEKAEVIAYIEGVECLLNSLECLKKAKEQSEDQPIILTNDLIKKMISELEVNDYCIKW